jgi:nucleoside 2-deoxyribosyltransferase
MTTKKVYLAGPIAGLTHGKATYSWRQEVFDALHKAHLCDNSLITEIACYSPMRGKKFLADKGVLGSFGYDNPISRTQAILGRDRDDVRKSDLVFMNLIGAKAVSIGTTVELGWADAYRVPVLLCMEDTGNPHEHLFFDGLCMYRCNSVKQGIALAKAVLLPNID